MSKNIFDIDLTPLEAKQGKRGPSSKRSIVGDKATIARTVRGAPEVMVKIVSTASDKANTQALVDYISQQGRAVVEDENGHQFIGPHTVDDALYDWHEIPEAGDRREVMHVIVSMPQGSDPHTVLVGARAFAAKEFGNHKYLFAQHTETDHAHCHILVNMSPIRGNKRLNPWKDDLQRWRESFAEKLQAQGLDCNATPRAARGQTRKAKTQAVYELDKRHKEHGTPLSKNTQSAIQAARDEVNGKPRTDIPRDALEASRARVMAEYATVVDELMQGNESDKALAVQVKQFSQALPPIATRHDVMVEGLREHGAKREKTAEQGRAPER